MLPPKYSIISLFFSHKVAALRYQSVFALCLIQHVFIVDLKMLLSNSLTAQQMTKIVCT